MGYELSEPPTGASDIAKEMGLSQMAKEGLGYAWQQDFVRSAVGRNFDPSGMMEQGGNRLINQGLLHSGQMDAVLPSAIATQGQNIASDAYTQAIGRSDEVATRAEGMQFQLAQHEDRMQLDFDIARSQLESQEQNWWDYVIGGASVASSLVGVGQGVGVLKG